MCIAAMAQTVVAGRDAACPVAVEGMAPATYAVKKSGDHRALWYGFCCLGDRYKRNYNYEYKANSSTVAYRILRQW